MHESRTIGGDPVLFAITALIVLFAVAIVGLGVEIGFSRRRGKRTRRIFSHQVVEVINPLSYTYTRHSGRLELHVSCSMSERISDEYVGEHDSPREQLDFSHIKRMKSKTEEGAIILPKPPKTPL